MSDRERRIPTDVSRVRRCRRVTLLQRGGQRAIADRSRPAAVADGLELAVPRQGRQPDFNLDVRVRRRRKRGRHTAKRRQLAELLHRRRARPRQTESSGGHHLGQGNRRVRERQGRQALARRRGVERVSVHHEYQCEENRARSASYCFHRTVLRSSDAKAVRCNEGLGRRLVLKPTHWSLAGRRLPKFYLVSFWNRCSGNRLTFTVGPGESRATPFLDIDSEVPLVPSL